MDELKELPAGVSSCSPKETDVHDESDAVKVLVSRTEMRFLEQHSALVEAANAHRRRRNIRVILRNCATKRE